jgi:hypothetical protein
VVVEDDAPRALLARPSAFAELWQKQRLAESLQAAS